MHKQHGKWQIVSCYYSQYHSASAISWMPLIVNSKDGIYFVLLFTLTCLWNIFTAYSCAVFDRKGFCFFLAFFLWKIRRHVLDYINFHLFFQYKVCSHIIPRYWSHCKNNETNQYCGYLYFFLNTAIEDISIFLGWTAIVYLPLWKPTVLNRCSI